MKNVIILDSERRYFPTSNLLLKKIYEFLEDWHLRYTYNFFILPKIKKYLKSGDSKIIAVDKETEIVLNKNHFPFSSIEDYAKPSEFKDYNYKMIEFIRNLPKALPELAMRYKTLDLWKNEETAMYEQFFPQLIINIELIHKIVRQEKAEKLIIFNSGSRLGQVLKNFNIKKIDRTDIFSKIKKLLISLILPVFLKIKSRKIGVVAYKKYPKSPKRSERIKTEKSREIIFFDRERAFNYSYSYLEKLKRNVSVLQDEEYHNKKSDFDYYKLDHYFSSDSKVEIMKFKKFILKKWKDIKRSKEFKKKLEYRGVNLVQPLKEMFEYLFYLGYLENVRHYECFDNYFNSFKEKPKLVILMGEGPKGHKVILNVSKKHQIKSLYVMHGIFGEGDLEDNLLSDKIAVYGRHYGQILTQLGNNSKKIVVTGNPAWDNWKEKLGPKKIPPKIMNPGIKSINSKKTILFATTNMLLDIKNRLANAVIHTISKIPEQNLIIKLHPEEKPEFYQNILDKFDLKATIVEDVSQLRDLIRDADLIIAPEDSTVGLQVLLLGKPLICVNLSKLPHYQDYIECGVALGVRKEENLLPAIKSILEDKKVRKNLEKNRKSYVYNHAYKQDGKASERVAKLIHKMLKESEKEKKQD